MLAWLVTMCASCERVSAAASPVPEASRWGSVVVEPGQKASGVLPVPSGSDGATEIPLTVVRGARPGPVVGVVAGVHGSEYVPILASQRLREALSPADLAGTVVLVHAANPPSFFKRTIYASPVDWKNLNRAFPGKPDGTLTERIAYVLTRDIIERVDAFIDMHCGDANEALTPYVGYVTTPDRPLAQRARAMALVFGVETIKVRSNPIDPSKSRYSVDTAASRGKPAIAVEVGQLAQTPDTDVTRVVEGVHRVLQRLGVLAGEPAPVAHPRWVARSETVSSPVSGIFTPFVAVGQSVEAGAPIGVVRDFFGHVLSEPRAPIAGEILFVTKTPPINAEESVASVGQLGDAP
ncbi:succinylglutamate desuccinylase/aspartoacylase family protein [Pendulispora albinea]|uniref:Succinylglutamate desuccinylase/aspartoacylase family protein n=1 Tax=Pendulispora albinea TaxID=2741071 RepID=A0ABZ2M6H5_9BACT